jgi:hypothetical protein
VDTVSLSSFVGIQYFVTLKQGSLIRTSNLNVQTDGTSVDSMEYGITETNGTMSGVVVVGTVSGSDAVVQVTVTNAASTSVSVKMAKVAL